jgi:hypothetical protein
MSNEVLGVRVLRKSLVGRWNVCEPGETGIPSLVTAKKTPQWGLPGRRRSRSMAHWLFSQFCTDRPFVERFGDSSAWDVGDFPTSAAVLYESALGELKAGLMPLASHCENAETVCPRFHSDCRKLWGLIPCRVRHDDRRPSTRLRGNPENFHPSVSCTPFRPSRENSQGLISLCSSPGRLAAIGGWIIGSEKGHRHPRKFRERLPVARRPGRHSLGPFRRPLRLGRARNRDARDPRD